MPTRIHRLDGEDRRDGERHDKIARKALGDSMGDPGVLNGGCHGDCM